MHRQPERNLLLRGNVINSLRAAGWGSGEEACLRCHDTCTVYFQTRRVVFCTCNVPCAGLLSPSSPPYPPSPPPLPPSPQQAPVSSPSSVNATAIAVPVTVGVVAIAAIIAFFMWRHHRRSQAADQMDKIEHGSGGDAAGIKGMSEVSSGAGSSLPHVPIKASPSSPSAFGTTATNSAPTTGVSTPPHPHPSSGTAEDLPSGSQDPFVGVVLDDLPQKPVMPEAPALLPLAHAVPAATLDVNGQPPLRLDIDVKRDVALGRLIGTGSFAMVHVSTSHRRRL